MATNEQGKKELTPKEKELLLRASEQFFTEGGSKTACDKCGSLIQFRTLSETAWEHWCECGKFNGMMRGL